MFRFLKQKYMKINKIRFSILALCCGISIIVLSSCSNNSKTDTTIINQTLSSISVSSQRTEFTIGDDFVFDGIVTATMSDNTTKDVTKEATISKPDMSIYGYKTVSVSYTYNNVTKQCFYDILVKINEPTIEEEGHKYMTFYGEFSNEENYLVSSTNQSLSLDTEHSLSEGTLSTNITSDLENDRGIVFLVKHNTDNFWEGEGVFYYFFFISNSGDLCLGKTNNGGWTNLGNVHIKGYKLSKTYNIKISFEKIEDGAIQFYCFLDNQIYFASRDFEDNVGNEFGVRANKFDTKFTYIKSSEIIEKPSRLQVGDLYVANGSLIEQGDYVCSTSSNSIAYFDDSFELGTFEAKMIHSGVAADSGIIFGLERNGNVNFWESNVSYYFFFISSTGSPYLGRVNNGSWSALSYVPTPVPGEIFVGREFSLKIERTLTNIKCYIDGVEYIDYKENCPLLGKEYGLRSGVSSGFKFTSFNVNKTGSFIFEKPTDYEIVRGDFMTINNIAIISRSRNSIALKKSSTFENGTLTLDYTQGSTHDAGIIFKADDSLSSYYLFYVRDGRTHLAKYIDNQSVELVCDNFLSASYGSAIETPMKVVIINNDIYCYLKGILYAHYHDDNVLTGKRFGLYSELPLACFNNVNLDIEKRSIETNKTLIIGHSYMELWKNYASDLNKFDDIYDIGIGGSIASDWNNMEDNVVQYCPETIIYMIGINDFPRGISPEIIANNVNTLVLNLKNRISTLKEIILVSVNRTVTHEQYKVQIGELNLKYRSLVSKYNYLKYADVDNAFLTNGVPDPKYFTDGLHPTETAYLTIANAIYVAAGKESK